jgi:hypothetical protein
VGHAVAAKLDERVVIDACATQIVATTPIAYLPENLARAVPWAAYDPIGNLEAYTPQQIRSRIGGSLRQAQVFAARAHAVFDLATTGTVATTDGGISVGARSCDVGRAGFNGPNIRPGEPTTVGVLNEAANEIALAVQRRFPEWSGAGPLPLVREISSGALDELQAADIAAGWARDALELGDVRSLGAQFERVWANGFRVK